MEVTKHNTGLLSWSSWELQELRGSTLCPVLSGIQAALQADEQIASSSRLPDPDSEMKSTGGNQVGGNLLIAPLCYIFLAGT